MSDRMAERVSRDQILMIGANGDRQKNIRFLYLADHVQDWQSHPRLIHALLYMCDGHAHSLKDIHITATVLIALLSSLSL